MVSVSNKIPPPQKKKKKIISEQSPAVFVSDIFSDTKSNFFIEKTHFIALILPIQWTIANPVGSDRPAKRQKKASCVSTGWPVRSTVHSPDGASYFLPV